MTNFKVVEFDLPIPYKLFYPDGFLIANELRDFVSVARAALNVTQNWSDDGDERDVALRKKRIADDTVTTEDVVIDADDCITKFGVTSFGVTEKVDASEVVRQVERDDDDLEDVTDVAILFMTNLVFIYYKIYMTKLKKYRGCC